MSLGYIIVCGDDGKFYDTEIIDGPDWQIILTDHSYGSDVFCVRRGPRAKGERRVPLMVTEQMMKIVKRDGLPIAKLSPTATLHSRGIGKSNRTQLESAIQQWSGNGFPSRFLGSPIEMTERVWFGTSVIMCKTKAHNKQLKSFEK